jgi:hypothetical protein
MNQQNLPKQTNSEIHEETVNDSPLLTANENTVSTKTQSEATDHNTGLLDETTDSQIS